MSFSSILSQDITDDITPPAYSATLGSREQIVFRAYQNEPWLAGTASNLILDKKLVIVDRELLFQVLMVENITKSKLTQIDDIKTKLDPKKQKVDRLRSGAQGNGAKKYEVITQVDMEDDGNVADNNCAKENNSNNNSSAAKNKAVFKLTLQSKSGDVFFAINSTPISWSSCMLGSKIVILPGTVFNRGVFILKDSQVIFLGGINRVWNENRDQKFCDYLESKLKRDKQLVNGGSKKRKAND
ncbi:BPK_HP2_G0053160.mRNA.1.CDS.1 [Saccharomyces cerevisiae]|nr:BPK_HP2_G0053160.mRNA.1.CDS.1 [Saccharomyces cerevisiae]CAI6766164.1 BPK_HP2_G0053160.mRNA.1.CDS.1 [Saccharomyces cerevisiae]CAI6800207.1 BPK_HP1_G0056470.mRNA.1.CDS.1 [Saccharomyces cerevisiae]CAI7461129.1 BPK_collapsed_G0055050.mRNA.1.CDS.1 [Saccharomyces cerevisiae]